jgi:hypothetical protein
MFEITVVILLAFIAFKLYSKKQTQPISKSFYFSEENHLIMHQLYSTSIDMEFYTTAEIKEYSRVGVNGLVKQLTFSGFNLLYDKAPKKFFKTSVKIYGADGYDRHNQIGFYTHSYGDRERIDVSLRLSINEYDTFLDELKAVAKESAITGEIKYFLYSFKGFRAYEIDSDNSIFYVNSIGSEGVYAGSDAHKIGLMRELMRNDVQYEHNQAKIRNELLEDFKKIRAL